MFIQLDSLKGISDEIALEFACQFCLHFDKNDLRFACLTSTDYMEWIQVLEYSLEIVFKVLKKREAEQEMNQQNQVNPLQYFQASSGFDWSSQHSESLQSFPIADVNKPNPPTPSLLSREDQVSL